MVLPNFCPLAEGKSCFMLLSEAFLGKTLVLEKSTMLKPGLTEYTLQTQEENADVFRKVVS